MSIRASACANTVVRPSSWRQSLYLERTLLIVVATLAICGSGMAEKLAVLDFRAVIGGAPPDFGISAARLVAEAFAATGKYDVLSYSAVRQELGTRNLRPPFGVGHIQLLADVLDAELVVHGSIRSLSYEAEQRSASVVVAMEIVDGLSGDLRKRVEAAGSFTSQTEAQAQEVLLSALRVAVRKAVELATGQAVPEESPRAGVPGSAERPGSASRADESVFREPALPAALLPAMEASPSAPMTAIPTTDLKPGTGATAAVVQAPQRAGGAGEGATGAAGPASEGRPQSSVSATPGTELHTLAPEDATADLDPLVRAKILAKLGPDRVLITLGGDSAVSPKMEMDVYRVTVGRDGTTTRRKLGRIRVVRVNPTDAEARILEGGDLMATGDYAFYFGD